MTKIYQKWWKSITAKSSIPEHPISTGEYSTMYQNTLFLTYSYRPKVPENETHKFQSGRVCVSVCGLFFKFNLKQNYNQKFERLKENKLCDLVETKKIAKIPRNIFRGEFFRFSLEITEFFEEPPLN